MHYSFNIFFFFAKSACLPGICQILYFTETSTAQSSLVLDLTALLCCIVFWAKAFARIFARSSLNPTVRSGGYNSVTTAV